MFIFSKLFKRQKAIGTSALILQGRTTTSWPERNYENYVKESYLKNIISFRCVDIIAKSCASVPWVAYFENTLGERQEVADDVITRLLKRPNPGQSWLSLVYSIISYLPISGNSFILGVAALSGSNVGRVMELYSLRPDTITIQRNQSGDVVEYEHRSGTDTKVYPVDPITGRCQIKHIKLFNPLDATWGTSVTEPAARDIDLSNSQADWNKGLLDNQARPGMVLSTKDNLSDQQFDRLRKQCYEEREGAMNAGKTLILEGATIANSYGYNPIEMDFTEGQRETARRICSAYGVPPQMIGIKGDSTFANYEQARLSFWEDTVIFYLELLQQELNHWLFKDSEIYLEYDLNEVPVFIEKKIARLEKIDKMSFYTTNEKREAANLEPVEGGDSVLISSTLIPLNSDTMLEDTSVENEEGESIIDAIEFE